MSRVPHKNLRVPQRNVDAFLKYLGQLIKIQKSEKKSLDIWTTRQMIEFFLNFQSFYHRLEGCEQKCSPSREKF